MKTIILYGTKYGASREIAARIAERLSDAVVRDLKKDDIPPLSGFDCVIIGGSLYAGTLRAEAKEFAKNNESALSGKKLGLFLSGMEPHKERADGFFAANFPKTLLNAAKAKAFPGGIFDPSKAGFLDKAIYKAVAKQSSYVNSIQDESIDNFVKELMS